MWLTITALIRTKRTRVWITKLSRMLLAGSFLFCVGAFGTSGIRTMTEKLTVYGAPMNYSGNDSGTLTALPRKAVQPYRALEKMSMTKKLASEPSNIAARDGK